MRKSIFSDRTGIAGMVFALVVCGMAAAMVLAARESPGPEPSDDGAGIAQPYVAPSHTSKPMGSRAAVVPAVATTTITTEAVPAATAGVESTAAPEETSAAVTLSGCLARAGDTFRLTNTEGAEAPKARSWKSGFLKKGSAPVEVVDASNRLRLSHHVGHRVALTGSLIDRQMHARSLQPIAASCN